MLRVNLKKSFASQNQNENERKKNQKSERENFNESKKFSKNTYKKTETAYKDE